MIARATRATARVARTIPSCPCYTSPSIVRATLAVALGLGQGAACIVRAILAVALAIIHRPWSVLDVIFMHASAQSLVG